MRLVDAILDDLRSGLDPAQAEVKELSHGYRRYIARALAARRVSDETISPIVGMPVEACREMTEHIRKR